MATKKNEPQEQTTLDNLNNTLTSAGESIVKNSKALSWGIGAVVIVALAIIAYVFFVHKPNVEKSNNAFNNVEITAAGNDSIAVAEYQKVADEFGGTDGGNLAALAAGERLYDMGKYEEALKYLLQFDSKEDVIMANAQCLIGDCYVNLQKYEDAISYFDKAIGLAEGNEALMPRFLDKKATVYDELKQYDKALQCYETIKAEYPEYGNGNYAVDAYISRENVRLGK